MKATVADFAARRWTIPPDETAVDLEPLTGGLESAVARVSVRRAAASAPVARFVKQLGAWRREADVYEALWRHVARPPAPRLLGVSRQRATDLLYLEDVSSIAAWPWADPIRAAAVCRELARLHDTATLPRQAFAWGYEAELRRSADTTVELAARVRTREGARYWGRPGDLRRVAGALPIIRRRLLRAGATIIHGDMHPGNVLLRDAGDPPDVLFIDWSRARIGSPLEDVASWLHSLGCCEPQARRRHDWLLRDYLAARQRPLALTRELRVEYWFASASNGLAGAIRYHLAVLGDAASTAPQRARSEQALRAWSRVIRRCAALLGTTPHRRRSAPRPGRRPPSEPSWR
jgi:hypothetical protein